LFFLEWGKEMKRFFVIALMLGALIGSRVFTTPQASAQDSCGSCGIYPGDPSGPDPVQDAQCVAYGGTSVPYDDANGSFYGWGCFGIPDDGTCPDGTYLVYPSAPGPEWTVCVQMGPEGEGLNSSPADTYGDGDWPQDGSSLGSEDYGDGDQPQDGSGDASYYEGASDKSVDDGVDMATATDLSTSTLDAESGQSSAVLTTSDGQTITVNSFPNTGGKGPQESKDLPWPIKLLILLLAGGALGFAGWFVQSIDHPTH
jgi:hypothetical protein